MRECPICCVSMNICEDVIYLACSQVICIKCVQGLQKCCFCQTTELKGHVLSGVIRTLAESQLFEQIEKCTDCLETMSFRDSFKHDCPEDFIHCNCMKILQRKNYAEHMYYSCEQVLCIKCNEHHTRTHECLNAMKICFHCDEKIPNNILSDHIENFHKLCGNKGCNVITSNLEAHQGICEYYNVVCYLCQEDIPFCLLAKHNQECLRRIVNCEHCNQTFTFQFYQEHHLVKKNCPHCKLQFDFICDFKLHEKQCDFKFDNCKCGKAIQQRFLKIHEDSECELRPTNCEVCGENNLTFNHILEHYVNHCPKFFTRCAIQNCLFQTKRENIKEEHKCPQTETKLQFEPGELIDCLVDEQYFKARFLKKKMINIVW